MNSHLTESIQREPETSISTHRKDGASWPLTIFIIVFGLAAIVGMFWSSVIAVIEIWTNNTTYKYGYLIFPISLYLIWDRRQILASMRPRPTVVGLLAAFIFGALWLVAGSAHASVGEQLAVVGIIQSLFLATLGWRVYRALLFPFCFLWLLVPIGAGLTPILQKITTVLTVVGLDGMGIIASSDGNIIEISSGRYIISGPCASLSFFVGMVVYSLVYANLMYRSWIKRSVFVVLMPLIAVITNGIRTATAIGITDLTEKRIDLVEVHLEYGWVLFAIVICLTVWIGNYFRDPRPLDSASALDQRLSPGERTKPVRVALAAIAVVVVSGLGPASATYLNAAETARSVMFCLPKYSHAGLGKAFDQDWRPVSPGASAQLFRRMLFNETEVDLFVAYYWRQADGRELINPRNQLAKGWYGFANAYEVAQIEGTTERVNATRIGSTNGRRLVWHWYWVGGEYTDNPVLAKLLEARANLLDGERRAAFVAISTKEGEDPQLASNVLRGFVNTGLPLRKLLESAVPDDSACGVSDSPA